VPSCAEGGVLGVLPGIIGIIQATETMKLIMGIGEPLVGRFLIYDALRMKFRELKLRKDPDCPVCGTHPTVTKLIDYEQFCGITAAAPEQGVGAPLAAKNGSPDSHMTELTSLELKQRLDRGDKLTIVDVREPNELQINRIPGSVHIPLGDIPKRYNELDPDAELVMQCKSGVRSGKAADFLRSVGYTHVLNLKGGILDWIDKVDPSQPKY
jgi:adenylyltransferase/sulfurtransferase